MQKFLKLVGLGRRPGETRTPPLRQESAPLPRLHFLHIGKTGGSALKFALEKTPPSRCRIELHRHRVRLNNIPVGEKVMFFLRDPITRFVSGFYSRKREGYPLYHNKWAPGEEIAFGRFPTPNELATALSCEDPGRRQAAEEAMRCIGHVKWSYWDWFHDETSFRSRLEDIFFIGFQESLAADFETLKGRLGLPESARLPDKDDINSHRNPEAVDKHLDPVALENLQSWYSRDIAFYRFCRENAPAINARGELGSPETAPAKSDKMKRDEPS